MSTYVPVKPLGHVADGEDTKSLGGVGGLLERSVVLNNLVTPVGKLAVIVFVEVSDTAKGRIVELLSTTAKEDIRTSPVGPGVVGNTVKERLNDRAVLITITGMSKQTSGGSVGNESSADNASVSLVQPEENFYNGLELGVVEGATAGVGIDVQCIDRRLVASVESGGRVGRISDEAVDRVRHLVTDDGELVESLPIEYEREVFSRKTLRVV